jgi:hypothetical protein
MKQKKNGFNVGDKIICIDNTNYEDILTKGKEYIVVCDETQFRDYQPFIVVRNNLGDQTECFSKRFIKDEPEEQNYEE